MLCHSLGEVSKPYACAINLKKLMPILTAITTDTIPSAAGSATPMMSSVSVLTPVKAVVKAVFKVSMKTPSFLYFDIIALKLRITYQKHHDTKPIKAITIVETPKKYAQCIIKSSISSLAIPCTNSLIVYPFT